MTEASKPRADLKAGTVYEIDGKHGWHYFGQVTPEKSIAFFRHRQTPGEDFSTALIAPIMAVITVWYPSITRALRSGQWRKLGRFPLAEVLNAPCPSVQWPVGTSIVSVCLNGQASYDTRVDDPAIQDMELMAVWDAEEHIPARLAAEFEPDLAEWHIGGPIWRERLVKQEFARRFPETPHHRLPTDWIPAQRR